MRPITLPEPPNSPRGLPDIFCDVHDVHSVIRRAIVITSGSPCSEQQCIGLVRALGLFEKHVLYHVSRPSGGINEWLHWLPVSFHKILDHVIRQLYCYSLTLSTVRGKKTTHLHAENGAAVGLKTVLEADANQIVTMACETFEKDGPLLVVASGRDTISITSSIKRLTSENVFVVQIQPPWFYLNSCDLMITPHHAYHPPTQAQIPRIFQKWITPLEPPPGHVVLTVGALHQVDSASLRTGAKWHGDFAFLPKPLLVVNIGGPTRHCSYSADFPKLLTVSLKDALASCGTIRISFSTRTPEKISNVVKIELGDHPKVQICDAKVPNPHLGNLAWADAFVVTADSVGMISEACSTGKPVYVFGAMGCTSKFMSFHKSLRERGMIRAFLGYEDMSKTWSYPPLNDTAEAASKVREAIASRGWSVQP